MPKAVERCFSIEAKFGFPVMVLCIEVFKSLFDLGLFALVRSMSLVLSGELMSTIGKCINSLFIVLFFSILFLIY